MADSVCLYLSAIFLLGVWGALELLRSRVMYVRRHGRRQGVVALCTLVPHRVYRYETVDNGFTWTCDGAPVHEAYLRRRCRDAWSTHG